mmetsp:Transcript_27148/g.85439  ORF Transcript_27148/g.85439 Transcript_27148/m.85439 type:complete len:89 (+) Transcript_27148:178-444(+)|eukprot:CAMPEP_0118887848 /NCGR_PEP_ID=MMETSP1163-20130328/25402_1 /TAXON_ID=124430 /ORGANISM="Phaeomonas parva, Strain CCMP2877" /LENGTH=88 /DNA_ID=CAMNT_0006826375 /DNA_START=163 /DNA_END=429 /DNA_ORIENTATION=+
MARFFLLLALAAALFGAAEAFLPASGLQLRNGETVLMAHHVQNKGAKKARKNRPKKHRPSDINRKAPEYNVEAPIEGVLPAWTVEGSN